MENYLIDAGKVLFLFSFVMGLTSFLTWQERKQSAVMQDRIGANRADIFGFRLIGLFHIITDGIKMFVKQDFVPAQGNKFLHTIAPMISIFFALMAFAAVPFGGQYELGGYQISLQVLSLDIGLLFIFAAMSMGIYGFVLGGWASANNYALLGGMRASGQMISYEITMGATIIGAVMVYGTLNLQEMGEFQGQLAWGWLPLWGVVLQPLGCLLFVVAALAETKRVPFDIPEGESEIIGYFLEYSGMRFGMFFMTDFIETVLAGALTTALFFGGWQVPFLTSAGFEFPWGASIALPAIVVLLLHVGAFATKVFVLCFLFLLIRWTLPRFRWDQLMKLGWTIMLPASLVNIVLTGLVLLWVRI